LTEPRPPSPEHSPTPKTTAVDPASFLRVALGRWDSPLPTCDDAPEETSNPSPIEDPPPHLSSTKTLPTTPFAIHPGDEIGRYRLIKPLGEGGFGVVWLAEQTTPISRQVALKIIKVGMNTDQIVARFNAERQAIALMDHPGIASVFDAGTTANERPFFVMELVNGPPITAYCSQHRLSIAERLRLFIEVCRAVQHAHQKGILHRDLKPSNILITLIDGKPTPKIIDFGIAKAVDSTSIPNPIDQTRHDVLLGTPAYMSPEQAVLGNPDLDTRTDIYSLGVILYELLTGLTPILAPADTSSSLHEVLRSVQTDIPIRPSLRIRSNPQHTALCHLSSPAELHRQLIGDLDWITLKALDKDRRNRYNSADALANDVLNHLQDLPIAAGRPSIAHATLKFIRRNRLLVSSSAAILIALLLGVSIATYGLLKEKAMRTQAESLRNHAEQQRTLAEEEKQTAREQRDIAKTNEQIALSERQNAEATLQFLTQLLERTGEFVKQGRNPEALRLALDSLTPEIGQFSSNPNVVEAITGRTALIYRFLRDEKKSLTLVADQVRLLQESRPPTDHDLLSARLLYARTLYLQGQTTESHAQYDELVRQHQNLLDTRDGPRKLFLVRRNRADTWAGSGKLNEALREYEDIIDTATDEIRSHSSWPVLLRGYGQALMDANRLPEAANILSQTLSALPLTTPDEQHTASTIHINRSRLFVQMNDLTAAISSLERAIELQRQARGNNSPWLSEWLVELSRLYGLRHRYTEAINAAQTAIETALAIGQTERLHLCHRALADHLETNGEHDAAAASFRSSFELARQMLPPPNSAWLDLAHSMRNIALCDRFGEASSIATRLTRVLPSWRGDPERNEDLRIAESNLSFIHLASAESRNIPFDHKFIQQGTELAKPVVERFYRNHNTSNSPHFKQALQILSTPPTDDPSPILYAADFLAYERMMDDRWTRKDDAAQLLELASALRVAARHRAAIQVYHLAAKVNQPTATVADRHQSALLMAAETHRQIGEESTAKNLFAHLANLHRTGKDPIHNPILLNRLSIALADSSLKSPPTSREQKPSPPQPQQAKDNVPNPSP
jgi:eukaryotic-like serine/threonine-protein kinase